MSKNENPHSEWTQLVKNWRKVWDEYNEVMNRITLSFSKFENPPDEDIELAERLREQSDLASAKMEEFRTILINRQRG